MTFPTPPFFFHVGRLISSARISVTNFRSPSFSSGLSALRLEGFGIGGQVADEDHFVDAAHRCGIKKFNELFALMRCTLQATAISLARICSEHVRSRRRRVPKIRAN